MRQRSLLCFLATATLGLCATATVAAGEISLFGTYSTGTYGTDLESDIQATALRYATGDRFQFRAELPYLTVETSETLGQPGLGPVPGPPRGGKGAGQGGIHGGAGGSSGAGTGPLTPGPADEPLSTEPAVSERTSGVGDVRLGGFVRLLGGRAKVYRMDIGLEVKAPTADAERYLGTGEWDYRAALSGEYRFWTATTFGTLGWNQLGDPAWVELDDALDLIVGAESEPMWDRIILTGWVEGSQEVVDETGNRTALGIGIRSTGYWRWRLMATAGLRGAAEDFSVAFGVSVGLEPPKTGIGGLGL